MKFGLKDELLKEIILVLKKHPKIQRAVIYGSRSRNDYRDNSDIDIAIFTNSEERLRTKVLGDLNEINTLFKFDVVEFEKLPNEKLAKIILYEGIQIYPINCNS